MGRSNATKLYPLVKKTTMCLFIKHNLAPAQLLVYSRILETNQEVADAHNSVHNTNIETTQLGTSNAGKDELDDEDIACICHHERLDDLEYEEKRGK